MFSAGFIVQIALIHDMAVSIHKKESDMGDYSVPEEIRRLKPKGTSVKPIKVLR